MIEPFWYAPLAWAYDAVRRRLAERLWTAPWPLNEEALEVKVAGDDWDRLIAATWRDWTDDDIPAPIEERPFVRHYDCSARRFGKTLAIMAGKEAPI